MKCVILLLCAIIFVIVEGGPLPEGDSPELKKHVHRFVKKGPEKIKKFTEGGDGGEGGGGGGEVKEIGGPKLKKHVHHYKIPGGGFKKEISGGGATHVHHFNLPGGGAAKEIEKGKPGKIKKHVHKFKKAIKGGGGGGGAVGGEGGGKRQLGLAGGGPPGDGGNEGKPPRGAGSLDDGHEDKITKDRGKNSRPGVGCQEGLLTGTARELDSAIKGLTSGIAAIGGKQPGILNNILQGAEALVDDTAGGLDQAVSDFFCGFNRVFNDIGTDLGKGQLLHAVGSGAITFVTGAGSFFGNLGFNAISAVVSGASRLINGPKP